MSGLRNCRKNSATRPSSTIVSLATAVLLILARAGRRRSLDHLSQQSWPYFTRSTGHCDKMPTWWLTGPQPALGSLGSMRREVSTIRSMPASSA